MQSESINELAAALVAAQGEFEKIKKGRTAKITSKRTGETFEYDYADFSDIIETLGPTLKKHGLAVTQSPSIADGVAALTTTLLHTSGQWISNQMLLYVAGEGAQAQGSAISYARRYAYTSVLGVTTENDDDGAAASQSKPNAAVNENGEVDPRVEFIVKAAGKGNSFVDDLASKWQQYGKLSEAQLNKGSEAASKLLMTPRSAPQTETPFFEPDFAEPEERF